MKKARKTPVRTCIGCARPTTRNETWYESCARPMVMSRSTRPARRTDAGRMCAGRPSVSMRPCAAGG